VLNCNFFKIYLVKYFDSKIKDSVKNDENLHKPAPNGTLKDWEKLYKSEVNTCTFLLIKSQVFLIDIFAILDFVAF
jgi:hypothetical protein